jgi:hypothetical protein
VVGRIAGVAHNTSSTNPNDDSGRTVSFGAVDADATLEGVLPPTLDVPGGTVIGAVTFAGSDGTTVDCNSGTVSWSMSGPPPSFITFP